MEESGNGKGNGDNAAGRVPVEDSKPAPPAPVPLEPKQKQFLYRKGKFKYLTEQDLALLDEVDGASHKSKKQRNRDAKKQLMLESLGWCVIRFWNSKIENNLPQVVARIQARCDLKSSRLSP